MKTHWKLILGLLGVVLPSLFTYLASRSEANEASIRAEVSYSMWQDAVKALQDESYKHALDIAEIKGELKARTDCAQAKATVSLAPQMKLPPKPEPVDSADADGIPDSPLSKARPKPPSFNDAVQSYKAKK